MVLNCKNKRFIFLFLINDIKINFTKTFLKYPFIYGWLLSYGQIPLKGK